MASTPLVARTEKPSFAKIVAAGIKPLTTQSNSIPASESLTKNAITSAPRDTSQTVAPSKNIPSASSVTAKKLVPVSAAGSQESGTNATPHPKVCIHSVDGNLQHSGTSQGPQGSPITHTLDESGTQVSSSSDSGKLPSLDSKSVVSGATFALDEKESLRPDDSASVKAHDDEDVFSPPSTGLPVTHIGSEEGVRAFRDQLREISSMDSTRRTMIAQPFVPVMPAATGVLYVPPQGPGIGVIPSALPKPVDASSATDPLPDPKLLEALENPRDRIWVLKLEQDINDFLKDPKEATLNLPQCNAYQRMLAHRTADYYMLGHVVDDTGDGVRLYKTPTCRIPPPLTGITTPSTAASTPPPVAPQMKILRRGFDTAPAIVNGSNLPSHATSENSESGNEDEKKNWPPASREEREARYEAARLRIMGSARPSDNSDMPKENMESRSSSANGKKTRKKQRSDSEDGFEARSAYSAYYPPPYGTSGFNQQSAAQYAIPSPLGPSGSVTGPPAVNEQSYPAPYQQFNAQPATTGAWPSHNYVAAGPPGWNQAQQLSQFDLSSEFQQTMNLHSTATPTSPAQAVPYPLQSHQPYGAQPTWSGQQTTYQSAAQTPQQVYGYSPSFQTQQSTFQPNGVQTYPYGQLPSQAFPGRPPSKLEHPLPGSYRSKHFNPQSRAFVPSQPNPMGLSSYVPPPVQQCNAFVGQYPMPTHAGRPMSANSGVAAFGSPQHAAAAAAAAAATPAHAPAQPSTHPLPQPVFPQAPSPSMPLPPKPNSMPQNPALPPNAPAPAVNGTHGNGGGGNASSISKWGTPASLPAKPPPSAEPFDPARFPQLQRQPSYNTASAARMPGAMSFGSMPPMAVKRT